MSDTRLIESRTRPLWPLGPINRTAVQIQKAWAPEKVQLEGASARVTQISDLPDKREPLHFPTFQVHNSRFRLAYFCRARFMSHQKHAEVAATPSGRFQVVHSGGLGYCSGTRRRGWGARRHWQGCGARYTFDLRDRSVACHWARCFCSSEQCGRAAKVCSASTLLRSAWSVTSPLSLRQGSSGE